MFGITKEIAETSNPVQLPILTPGIYDNVTLKEVTFGPAEKKDGTAGKNLLNFKFETEAGSPYVHSEWEIDALPENADKITNLTKRVSHIMSKFMDKDKTVSPSFNSYSEFANWVVKSLNAVKGTAKVKLKIVGSVYNGKRKAGFPNYLGFIAVAGEALSFSAKEIESNQEWAAFTPDKPSDVASTPIVKDEF
jgi:hypothetical protein